MYLFVYLYLEFFSVFFFYHTIRRNLSSLTAQVSANFIQNIQNVVTGFYFLLSSKHRIGHDSPVILKATLFGENILQWQETIAVLVGEVEGAPRRHGFPGRRTWLEQRAPIVPLPLLVP